MKNTYEMGRKILIRFIIDKSNDKICKENRVTDRKTNKHP